MVLSSDNIFNPFPTSDVLGNGLGANSYAKLMQDESTIIWNDVGIGIVPIGAVVAWLKSLGGVTPALIPSFVECNGQVLADADSVYNGVTIPNLNASGGGAKRFLMGSTSSGTTGGANDHSHTYTENSRGTDAPAGNCLTSIGGGATTTLPPYYEIVWVMRIK